MNLLPVGPFERVKEIPERIGLSQSDYLVQREDFVAMQTKAIAGMYKTGGKQLTDKELENLKADILDPNIPPQQWLARFSNLYDDALDTIRGRIKAYESAGYSTKELKEVLKGYEQQHPGNYLPKELRKHQIRAGEILSERGGNSANSSADAARKLYDQMEGK